MSEEILLKMDEKKLRKELDKLAETTEYDSSITAPAIFVHALLIAKSREAKTLWKRSH